MKRIVYAHGFISSSHSRKALTFKRHIDQLREEHRIAVEYLCPDLNFDPEIAIAQLDARCRDFSVEDLTVIGSSLGGFYALVMAERFGCRAVLLNPSIRPYETLARHLGPQVNLYTREKFTFTQRHVEVLREMAVTQPTRLDRYFLLAETGDEVLDYRVAQKFYAGAKQIIVEGGDHELKSLPQHIDAVLTFSGLGT
jgi:uncharacterized protein